MQVNLLASFSFNASDGTPGCAWRRWLEGDWDWDRQDPECISPLCSCNINFEYEPGMYNASFRVGKQSIVLVVEPRTRNSCPTALYSTSVPLCEPPK